MLLVHHIALATANVIKTLLVCYYYCALASFECVCACWLPLSFCMFGDIFCVLCIIIWYLRVYIALCGRVSSILSPFSVARLVLCPPVIYIGSIFFQVFIIFFVILSIFLFSYCLLLSFVVLFSCVYGCKTVFGGLLLFFAGVLCFPASMCLQKACLHILFHLHLYFHFNESNIVFERVDGQCTDALGCFVWLC